MGRSALVVVTCLSIAASALADGGFLPPKDYTGADISEPCQRAVIVHSGGKETLFLFVDYHGGAEHFAWIVPCPSEPEVDTADPEVFAEVAGYFHHLEMEAWKREMKRRGPMKGVGGGGSPEASQVTVHMTKIVGPYEISVLSSTGAGALTEWLKKHGYRVPRGLDPVLAEYVKEKWYFAAVKVRAETGRDVTLKPLRLDFEAKVPVYPLRISSSSRGVTDIRVYLFREPASAELRWLDRQYGSGFRVDRHVGKVCPKLVKTLPRTGWRKLVLSRVTDRLVPQVMRRLDDRIHVLQGRYLYFYPWPSLAKTAGIAEALASKNPAEAGWAERNLHHYYQVRPRPGESPKEHLAALNEIGKRLGKPLQDKLIELIDTHVAWSKFYPTRRRVPLREWPKKPETRPTDCEGAIALLARLGATTDAEVIRCLEEAASVQRLGSAAVNALMDLGSPESRRALARIVGPQDDAAAFRYVYSLERDLITRDEQFEACVKLLHMLSSGIAVGDARTRGIRLLKRYTGQDLGEDWEKWMRWLGEHAHEFKTKDE